MRKGFSFNFITVLVNLSVLKALDILSRLLCYKFLRFHIMFVFKWHWECTSSVFPHILILLNTTFSWHTVYLFTCFPSVPLILHKNWRSVTAGHFCCCCFSLLRPFHLGHAWHIGDRNDIMYECNTVSHIYIFEQ